MTLIITVTITDSAQSQANVTLKWGFEAWREWTAVKSEFGRSKGPAELNDVTNIRRCFSEEKLFIRLDNCIDPWAFGSSGKGELKRLGQGGFMTPGPIDWEITMIDDQLRS
jgi:hypothetical protein